VALGITVADQVPEVLAAAALELTAAFQRFMPLLVLMVQAVAVVVAEKLVVTAHTAATAALAS
jgi:hypothetical protein